MSAKRILIVDDHEQIRLSISEILELQGYENHTAMAKMTWKSHWFSTNRYSYA